MADFWAEKVGRRTREDDSGGFAVRVYEGIYSSAGSISHAAGGVQAVALPQKGDGYPGSSAQLKLRTIEKTQITSSGQWEAVLTYLPRTAGLFSTSNAALADLPRSWSIGGELIQFADTGDYYYVTAGDNDPILGEVPAFKKVATGRLTIQEIVPDIDAARTRAKNCINTKNNAAFEGAAEGDMLYLGFESEEFTNNDGDKVWRLRHQFLERDIPDKASNGWEYVLRDDTAEWAYIQLSAAANDPLPIYPSTSFSQIFGTS